MFFRARLIRSKSVEVVHEAMCDVRGRLGVRHGEGQGHGFTAYGTSKLFKDFC